MLGKTRNHYVPHNTVYVLFLLLHYTYFEGPLKYAHGSVPCIPCGTIHLLEINKVWGTSNMDRV